MPKTKSIALILGVLIMSFLVGYLIFAWTEPSASPPGANVDVPVNVGSTDQVKSGGLGVDNFSAAGNALIWGQLRIREGGALPTFYTRFQGGDQSADLTYTLPTAYPAASGQVLSSTTTGTLSWAAAGGTGTVTSISQGTGITASPNPITTTGTLSIANPTKSCGAGTAIQSFDLGVATAPTCISVTGTLPSGSANQTLRHDGTNWVPSSMLLNTGNGGEIQLGPQDAGVEGGQLRFLGAGTNRYFYLDNYAGTLRFVSQDAVGESAKFVIGNDGNVGIGTTSPLGPLDVNGRASATSFKVYSTFADLVNNSPWYGIGTSNISLWAGQPTYYATQLAGYYGLNLQTANGRLVITGDTGNVGIGTTDPGTNKLKVAGDTEVTGNLNVGGDYYKGGVKGIPSENLRPTIVFSTAGSGSCGGGAETLISGTITVNTNSKIIIQVYMNAHVNSPFSNDFWLRRGSTDLGLTTYMTFRAGTYYDNSFTQYVDTVSAGTYTYSLYGGCEGPGQLSWYGINMILQAYSQ